MENKGLYKLGWAGSGELVVFGLPEIKPEIRFALVPGEVVYAVGDNHIVGSPVLLFPKGIRYEGVITINRGVADVDCMLFRLETNIRLCLMVMGKLVAAKKDGTSQSLEPIFTKKQIEQI